MFDNTVNPLPTATPDYVGSRGSSPKPQEYSDRCQVIPSCFLISLIYCSADPKLMEHNIVPTGLEPESEDVNDVKKVQSYYMKNFRLTSFGLCL